MSRVALEIQPNKGRTFTECWEIVLDEEREESWPAFKRAFDIMEAFWKKYCNFKNYCVCTCEDPSCYIQVGSSTDPPYFIIVVWEDGTGSAWHSGMPSGSANVRGNFNNEEDLQKFITVVEGFRELLGENGEHNGD